MPAFDFVALAPPNDAPSDPTTTSNASAAGSAYATPATDVRRDAGHVALVRLAEDLRRRRKGADADDAAECTVVTVTALTLDGRRTGKSFLARTLYVSSRGLAVLLDRPAPSTSFLVEWEGAPPMIFDLALSRRTCGRFEAGLVLRETPEPTPATTLASDA